MGDAIHLSLPSFIAASYGGFCFKLTGRPDVAVTRMPMGPDAGATFADVDARSKCSTIAIRWPGSLVSSGFRAFADFDRIYGPLLDGVKTHVPGILAEQGHQLQRSVAGDRSIPPHSRIFKTLCGKRWIEPAYALIDEPIPMMPRFGRHWC